MQNVENANQPSTDTFSIASAHAFIVICDFSTVIPFFVLSLQVLSLAKISLVALQSLRLIKPEL